ncbi:hypothetical protein M23134_00935 [Microscilla marina ATCC 23134]|uniref:Uncharacterized protein n=1 Tax=Microscilla marina ATCC 23134 TaxID=313606 RepID=A2A002_MICM2|nr:hypothetical protein M23134_00935 [Microscilla marina ATCC 23134]
MTGIITFLGIVFDEQNGNTVFEQTIDVWDIFKSLLAIKNKT